MVVLSNARPDLEAEFNDWYTNVHIVEVVDRLDGFEAAQRFALSAGQVEAGSPYKYLALYWVPEDKLEDAQAAIKYQRQEREEALAAGREPLISKKDVFDGQHHTWFFSKISERYTSASTADAVPAVHD
jgi:hypothetical protein